jgi:hypothetical protein
MANPLQIAQNSQLIESKAEELFISILGEYQRGEIKTEAELLYKIFTSLQDFYNSIGKPTMKIRPAWGPPMSSTWNDTMNEVFNDLQTLLNEAQLMSDALNQSFQQVEVQRQSFINSIQKIEDMLKDIETKINKKPEERIFTDRFINMNNFDVSMVQDVAADVSKEDQVLMLSRTEADTWQDYLTIRILENSNGFPGNTHQVRSLSGQLKFYGEDNLHINLAEIIDGNSDTWFEYELFELTPDVVQQTANFGFTYSEGVAWASETVDSLRLALQIEMPIARTINWINIAPFIPSDKGYNPPVIRSVIVDDGKGNYTEVSGKNDVFSDEKIYMFPKQKCKRVTILIEQYTPYETLIGHFFFRELESANVSYFGRTSPETAGKLVEGPKPSVENVGLRFDPKSQTLIQPQAQSGDQITNDADIKKALFQTPDVTGIQAGLESIPAWRYAIGIREVDLSTYQFEATSQYISVPFQTDAPIKGITLDVTEIIPSQFAQSQLQSPPWIRYFISIDNGKNWNEIVPRGRQGITQYIINANIPKEGRFPNVGYIDTLDPVNSVRLRIDLMRPTDIPDHAFYTPVVKEYKLHVVTEVTS